MRRLFLFFLASLCLHLLILVPFFPFRNPLPLSGGDRDSEVSIEIVGEDDAGEQRARDKRPYASQARLRPLAASDFSPGSGPVGGTDSLLAEIRRRIESAKHYPMIARKSQIEGVVLVGFQIDGAGQPESIRLKSSSGHPMLDQEALATIQRAAPFPAYEKSLEIGIRFEMND